MKIYRPQALFSGKVIGLSINDKYCAVPDKYQGYFIQVKYMAQTMVIHDWKAEAVAFREFEDKFGRKDGYTLGYFKWQPERSEDVTNNRNRSSSDSNPINPVLEQVSLIEESEVSNGRNKSWW